MKRIFILFLLGLSTELFAQKISNAGPEAAGFSSTALKKIDLAMNEWVDKGWMNGGAALIIRDGKIAYHEAFGYNDLDTKEKLDKNGIFRIASQTKAITSVAMMMLFDEGKVLLTDPVSQYIPSFKNPKVLLKLNYEDTTFTTEPAKREITIKDLLTHTSGLGYAQIGTWEANAIYAKYNLTAGIGVKHESLLSAMTRLGSLPLMHQPGEKWTYGLNTDLLGCLVEIISGQSLDEFFRKRIFEPLGMHDTYFTIPATKAKRLVNLYTEENSGKLVKATANMLNGREVTPAYPLESSSYFSGGAGLSSTLMDYAIFLQMLLNEGEYNGVRILGRNTVRMMVSNQIGDIDYGENKFGLGFLVLTERGSAAVPARAGTFSWGGAFATSYWVDPQEKMVYLFYRQLQRRTRNDVVEKFRALTYQALK